MKEIVCLKLKDVENYYTDYNNNDYNKYVIKDENFEKNLKGLKKIVQDYDNFQEVEEYISENFQEITIENYIIKY